MKLSVALLALSLAIALQVSTIDCQQGQATGEHNKLGSDGWKVPRAFDFGEYVHRFKKHYGKLETIAKAKLFFARTIQIFKHNVGYINHTVSYYLSQNEHIDLSSNETCHKLVLRGNELSPIEESAMAPNMPADDYYRQSLEDQHNDGLSKASAHVADNAKLAAEPTRASSVNFFADDPMSEQIDPRTFIHDLQSHERMTNEMAKLVELRNYKKQTMDKTVEKIRNSRKIKRKLGPMEANPNYDGSLVPSKGVWTQGSAGTFSRSFAELMMLDFSSNLEPYPSPPSVPTGPSLPMSSPVHSSPTTASGLLNLITDIYGYFSDDVKVEEENDDQETPEVKLDQHSAHDDVQAQQQQQMHLQQIDLIKQGPVKYDIDWRRTGCVSRTKSQQECNACYVFAALDLMEFFYCQQTKNLIEFSSQYVIDCGHKVQLNGCQGGKLSLVGLFIKTYGLQTSSVYPYLGQQQQCPYSPEDDQAQRSFQLKPHITRWRLHKSIRDWYEWLPKTPIIVGINMPADFLAYGGGVHDGNGCLPNMVHAMVLVGSGIQNGKTFWLLKNTFSYNWGEGGYFRLSKRAPLNCYNSAIVVKVRY